MNGMIMKYLPNENYKDPGNRSKVFVYKKSKREWRVISIPSKNSANQDRRFVTGMERKEAIKLAKKIAEETKPSVVLKVNQHYGFQEIKSYK